MKVVHCKKERYDVYIGRPGKWGNPFSVKQYGRQRCIELYREYILDRPELLGCWCKPLACHGDVLIDLIMKMKVMKNDG